MPPKKLQRNPRKKPIPDIPEDFPKAQNMFELYQNILNAVNNDPSKIPKLIGNLEKGNDVKEFFSCHFLTRIIWEKINGVNYCLSSSGTLVPHTPEDMKVMEYYITALIKCIPESLVDFCQNELRNPVFLPPRVKELKKKSQPTPKEVISSLKEVISSLKKENESLKEQIEELKRMLGEKL